MLTDEEIKTIASDWRQATGRLDFISESFARAIERAVLAKAGEQEPVGFIDSEGDPHLSVEGLKGGYLYIGDAPLPAKAIPENFIEAFDHILELLEYVTDQPVIIPEPTDSTIMRSVKKIVTKLRSLSASPKPEGRNREEINNGANN